MDKRQFSPSFIEGLHQARGRATPADRGRRSGCDLGYAANKVTNVRELRARLIAQPGLLADEHERARLDHYRESVLMLEEITPEHPLVRQLRLKLETLRALAPRTR